jgi:hypothetical protein
MASKWWRDCHPAGEAARKIEPLRLGKELKPSDLELDATIVTELSNACHILPQIP